MALLTFDEGYKERIWGGRQLENELGKPLPPNTPIGEAWLISDHPEHVSTVVSGKYAGRTLRALMTDHQAELLGSRARPTPDGRFPLLLKLLDAQDKLSIQVHPDDAQAKALGEPDVGKTEMWHVLQADAGSELYCGMEPSVTREQFQAALENGDMVNVLSRVTAWPGTTVFVRAGTVHAIGGGILLAEIQQNSDITYRIDDWGRVDAQGNPRETHVEKALEVTAFGARHNGAAQTVSYSFEGGAVEVLGACDYFAGERIVLSGAAPYARDTRGETFSLLLGVEGELEIQADDDSHPLKAGQACLVCGEAGGFTLEGTGACLHYYVPDLVRDIVEPLQQAGAASDAIAALGGDPATSDLARWVS